MAIEVFFSTYNYHIITHEFIINLFYHDLELRSSSFPFGRAQASLPLLSLNHDLAAIIHVDAGLRGLADELAAIQRVPRIIRIREIRVIRS